eukprot:CAMPEP_0167818658 /NCGR_PEP_ID=MMETSP0112_2-20121227/4929_1 /TAXON_ID=91324 /ORGANISM="Lotharella globosa, Strain CCCM811" /LENGTH=115 /DNA_ID=CAMNT_0007718671 /DNA_START=772 /DNA_END=1116 /DNA_ORIENTATION=+
MSPPPKTHLMSSSFDSSGIASIKIVPSDPRTFVRVEATICVYNAHRERTIFYRFRVADPFKCSLSDSEGLLGPCKTSTKRISLRLNISDVNNVAPKLILDYGCTSRPNVTTARSW